MQNPNRLAILEKQVGDPMVQEIEITMQGDLLPCLKTWASSFIERSLHRCRDYSLGSVQRFLSPEA